MVFSPSTSNGLAVMALLDTGAEGCSVSCRVVEALDLVQKAREPLITASGVLERVPVYEASFLLSGEGLGSRGFVGLDVTLGSFGRVHGYSFDVLFGWSVLSEGVLVTAGSQFMFAISPSEEEEWSLP